MILNFYIHLFTIKVFTAYTLWVIIFPLSSLGYVDLLDIFSRTLTSDFFTNTYYYFWTAFWYIPTLLFFLLLLFLFLSNFCVCKVYGFILLGLLAFVYELLDYWNLNVTFSNLLLNPDNLNLLLTNSINKYHPLLLYYALISVPLIFTIYIPTIYLTPTVFFTNTFLNKWVSVYGSINL